MQATIVRFARAIETGTQQHGFSLHRAPGSPWTYYFAAAAALVMSVWAFCQMPLMLLPIVT